MPPWIVGVGCAGIAASHWIAYRVAVPETGERAEVLRATGHRYWASFIFLSLGALLVSLALFARRLLSSTGSSGTGHLFSSTFCRLVWVQSIGFLVLETAERLLSGHHHDLMHLMAEPVIAVGLTVQIAVALAAALVLVGFRDVVVTLDLLLTRRPPTRSTQPLQLHPGAFFPLLRIECGSATLRGPPNLDSTSDPLKPRSSAFVAGATSLNHEEKSYAVNHHPRSTAGAHDCSDGSGVWFGQRFR
jgi:hypothetical protein